MLDERKTSLIARCLCLTTLLTTQACRLVNTANSLAPVRSLTLTVDTSQREEFINQLQMFSDKHGFKTDISYHNIKGEHFQFWMSREDIKIVASSVPPDPTLVYLDLYGAYSGASIDEEEIDELLSDLKLFINAVPNVTITEE
jgi:hypothetical protein